jgi:hypothetical protein
LEAQVKSLKGELQESQKEFSTKNDELQQNYQSISVKYKMSE